MMDLIRYFFSFVFLGLTIYFGIKGWLFPISKEQTVQNHKIRAMLYTAATFCGLISFEFYFPNLAGLICVPVLLLGIWMEYLTVASLLPKK